MASHNDECRAIPVLDARYNQLGLNRCTNGVPSGRSGGDDRVCSDMTEKCRHGN